MLRRLLLPALVIANENAPDQTVISGDAAAVDAAVMKLASLGLDVLALEDILRNLGAAPQRINPADSLSQK